MLSSFCDYYFGMLAVNVLSLFDGISCGHLALERADININSYFASEIDKYATRISERNFPQINRLGDVTGWRKWKLPKIDLLVGGSPCQGFSFAGKQLNFNDPRSKLFFEFVKILKHFNPKYFLLENVLMKSEYENAITDILGIAPVKINSALVSAQTRKRLYWTNIPGVKQPKNKSIFLKDILENGFTEKNKSYCLDAGYQKTSSSNPDRYLRKRGRQIIFKDIQTYSKISGNQIKKNCKSESQKSNSINTNSSVTSIGTPSLWSKGSSRYFRKLTVVECERLQTIPDNYTAHVSSTQRYKSIGNGWTVDVIAHILRNIRTSQGEAVPTFEQTSF